MVSTFGVMFTPNQDKAAAELLRVCRPGGKIGLANWTPDGFIGQVFKTIGKHVPPPAGAKSPALWGTHARLDEMFGARRGVDRDASRATSCSATARPSISSKCSGPIYGPVLKAFAALDPAGQEALHDDLMALIARINRAADGTHGGAERISRSDHHQALIRRFIRGFHRSIRGPGDRHGPRIGR